MGIIISSVRRRRAGFAVTGAVLGLLAAAGTPALAATDGSAGRSSAASGSAQGATPIPVGISRLAQGPGHNVAITIDDGPDPAGPRRSSRC